MNSPRNTNNTHNHQHQLELELDCIPENHHASLVVEMLARLKKIVIRAMEDKAGSTARGRLLRESGAIRIYVGTTGRYLQFGPLTECDEAAQLQAWRKVVSTCLDTLSAAIAFGHFMADMEAIDVLPEDQQDKAMDDMVSAVKARGGLLWERDRSVTLKGIDKIFKGVKDTQVRFSHWRMASVPVAKTSDTARLRAESKEAAEKLKAETDRIAKEAAEAAAKGDALRAELAGLQGQRLEAIGTPNVVAEVPAEKAPEEVVLPEVKEGGQPT
jgi:hypothetical protein